MAVIKIKRPNGEEHTFNLTDNSKDTGGNYIRVRFNGQDLYARVSGNVTPLNVVKPNGDRGYVQYDPITFNTWKWESRNVEPFNRWYVYLPKGKYRVLTEGQYKIYNDLVVQNSKTIEVTVTNHRNSNDIHYIMFNIDNQIQNKIIKGNGTNRVIIERTGNI
nr:MAG TPA: hypothetical protein [Caudoviricetes sp.]